MVRRHRQRRAQFQRPRSGRDARVCRAVCVVRSTSRIRNTRCHRSRRVPPAEQTRDAESSETAPVARNRAAVRDCGGSTRPDVRTPRFAWLALIWCARNVGDNEWPPPTTSSAVTIPGSTNVLLQVREVVVACRWRRGIERDVSALRADDQLIALHDTRSDGLTQHVPDRSL